MGAEEGQWKPDSAPVLSDTQGRPPPLLTSRQLPCFGSRPEQTMVPVSLAWRGFPGPGTFSPKTQKVPDKPG